MSDGQMIPRSQLEAVILRAAMLAATEADAEDRISEDELLRIAGELGLSVRHVRQALFEMPEASAQPTLLNRAFGPASVVGSRVIGGESEPVRRRLMDYLGTAEYLRLLRRQGEVAWFEPAEDTISHVVRAFRRPAGRFHLSHSRRVSLAVRDLEPGHVHVRIELDWADKRRAAVAAGGILGGLTGGLVATGGLLAVGALADLTLAPGIGMGLIITAVTGLGAGGGVGLGAVRFRRRTADANDEVDSLLDRLERGEQLEPPPAPWWKRIQRGLARPGAAH